MYWLYYAGCPQRAARVLASCLMNDWNFLIRIVHELGVVFGNKKRRFPVFSCQRASLQLLHAQASFTDHFSQQNLIADEYKLNKTQGHPFPNPSLIEYYLRRFLIIYAYCLMNRSSRACPHSTTIVYYNHNWR